MAVLFSVITPSRGDRPLGLANAARSLERAVASAGLADDGVEWLVGFDGVKGDRPEVRLPATFVDFPKKGDFGNFIRDRLLRIANGSHVLFLDDDNAFTETALGSFIPHLETEFIVGRIDVSRAFDVEVIPRREEVRDASVVRQGNIDPLCLCLSRDLVAARCGGWRNEGGYESDYLNILRYVRRARSFVLLDDVVGVYDAGCGLDPEGANQRQQKKGGA